jgi:hypothetical protein
MPTQLHTYSKAWVGIDCVDPSTRLHLPTGHLFPVVHACGLAVQAWHRLIRPDSMQHTVVVLLHVILLLLHVILLLKSIGSPDSGLEGSESLPSLDKSCSVG